MKTALFLPLIICASLSAQEVRIEHDVDYLGGERAEKADLYLPANPKPGEKHSAVLIIHGGGWSGGDKRAAREINIGTTLAQNGYAGMSINYALANASHPGPTWPQNLHEIGRAHV